MELIGTTSFDARGDVIKILSTIQDIIKQKKVELDLELERENLAKNQQLIAKTLEKLPVMVFAKDIKRDFKFIGWNKKAEKIVGIKSEACLGKNDYDSFPKESADFFQRKDLEAANPLRRS